MKKLIANIAAIALLIPFFSFAVPTEAATSDWNVSGNYVINMVYNSTNNLHDMTLSENSSGALTGSGGYPAGGAHTYAWTITSGSVSGNSINITANYTAPASAVTPQTVLNLTGTIAANGTMSGTWSDNYQGSARSGTWTTTSGEAVKLASEDFGVVNYDTGLGILKGYSAGFGLTNATFQNVQSVVVKLYAGNTLLQTNTATAKVGATITGSQISSPFDVSGNFNYATDGYWTNVRQSQYGQSLAATRVVATVTLASGQVLTAENTTLSGDATTIFSSTPTGTHPANKNDCKNGGWKHFSNPTYKNQGQCVSSIAKNNH